MEEQQKNAGASTSSNALVENELLASSKAAHEISAASTQAKSSLEAAAMRKQLERYERAERQSRTGGQLN